MKTTLKPIELDDDEIAAVSGGGTVTRSSNNVNSGNDNSFNNNTNSFNSTGPVITVYARPTGWVPSGQARKMI